MAPFTALQVAFHLELVYVDEGAAHGVGPEEAQETAARLHAALCAGGLTLPFHSLRLEEALHRGDSQQSPAEQSGARDQLQQLLEVSAPLLEWPCRAQRFLRCAWCLALLWLVLFGESMAEADGMSWTVGQSFARERGGQRNGATAQRQSRVADKAGS